MYDIDKEVAASRDRIHNYIYSLARWHRKEMRSDNYRAVKITVRDREHFYLLVHWCNKNCGQGREFWTVKGKVLRNIPVTKDWLIFTPWVDISPLLKL